MLKKIILWVLAVLAIAFVAAVIIRIPYVNEKKKTDEAVVKIHSTKLTLDDVLGKNLPAAPNPAEADKTVAGIDANDNGIRDDVEIAIFNAYPDSAKTRAVLLQYALALQTEMTLPLVNTETVTATIEDNESRALNCVWSISSRADMNKFMEGTTANEDFVKNRQFNTDQRKQALSDLLKKLGSYSVSHGDCDIALSTLPN